MSAKSALPRLSIDKTSPGVIRIEGTDAMTGILAGVRAPEIVRRCNSHDGLVAALELEQVKRRILTDAIEEVGGEELLLIVTIVVERRAGAEEAALKAAKEKA